MHLCYYMRRIHAAVLIYEEEDTCPLQRIHARICSGHVSSSSYNTRTCIHVHTNTLTYSHTTDHVTHGYGDTSSERVHAPTHPPTHPHLQYSTWLRGNEIPPPSPPTPQTCVCVRVLGGVRVYMCVFRVWGLGGDTR